MYAEHKRVSIESIFPNNSLKIDKWHSSSLDRNEDIHSIKFAFAFPSEGKSIAVGVLFSCETDLSVLDVRKKYKWIWKCNEYESIRRGSRGLSVERRKTRFANVEIFV